MSRYDEITYLQSLVEEFPRHCKADLGNWEIEQIKAAQKILEIIHAERMSIIENAALGSDLNRLSKPIYGRES